MARSIVGSDERTVMARLPFWFKQMAMDVGARKVPVESVGEVLVRLAGSALAAEYAAIPRLKAPKATGKRA